MSHWILIIMLLVNSGGHTHSVGFKSQATCEAAKQQILSDKVVRAYQRTILNTIPQTRVFCVKR